MTDSSRVIRSAGSAVTPGRPPGHSAGSGNGSLMITLRPALAPSLSAPGRRSLATWLSRHGAVVLEAAVVNEVRPDAVVFADGTVRASALTVWAAGFGVSELAAASGLRTDALGRLLTDETLTSVDDDHVVAAGDAAAPSDRPLRMSCYAAGPLGAQAADTVLSRIAGTTPAVIDLAFTGSCVSLGRRAGLRQFARKDDTATNVHFDGRMGAMYKELTCKLALWKIRREARLMWIKGGPRPGQPAAHGVRDDHGARGARW
ncbi:FAD-dependent oxidoreductase [Microbispora sp. NPDC049633]|uniref:FAD-dependent oxidoreductase n=1 Tax=Microbispora sp. NPDC049633 TaxID=3154355 RepID=UPI00342A089E